MFGTVSHYTPTLAPSTPKIKKKLEISNSPLYLKGDESPNLFKKPNPNNEDNNSFSQIDSFPTSAKEACFFQYKQMPLAGKIPFTLLDSSNEENANKASEKQNNHNQLKSKIT